MKRLAETLVTTRFQTGFRPFPSPPLAKGSHGFVGRSYVNVDPHEIKATLNENMAYSGSYTYTYIPYRSNKWSMFPHLLEFNGLCSGLVQLHDHNMEWFSSTLLHMRTAKSHLRGAALKIKNLQCGNNFVAYSISTYLSVAHSTRRLLRKTTLHSLLPFRHSTRSTSTNVPV